MGWESQASEDAPLAAEGTVEELERELGDILTSISTKLEAGEENELQYKQWLGTLAGLCQKSIDEFRNSTATMGEKFRDRLGGEAEQLAEVSDLRHKLMSLEAENAALQEQIGLGVRGRSQSDHHRTIEMFEESVDTLESELQAAKEQIVELRTANMRLEHENETLFDLEDRAASLTEENLRLQADVQKLGSLKGLEEEHENTVQKLKEALNENLVLEDETKSFATQVEDLSAQYERAKKQLDEANEILTIKQNMIEALRDSIEQQNNMSNESGLDLEAEVRASEGDLNNNSGELEEMRNRVLELESQNRAQLAQVDALQQKLASGASSSPRSPSAGQELSDEEIGGEELEEELRVLEEDFLTNVDRLAKGFGEIDKCITNVEKAVERSGQKLVKVAMEVKVASLAKETMAIQLRELFGAGGGLVPEFVLVLKAKLFKMINAQQAAKAAPKPILTIERLAAFKQRHCQVMGSAQRTIGCLSSILDKSNIT